MSINALSIIIVCNRVLRVQPKPRQVWHFEICMHENFLFDTNSFKYNHDTRGKLERYLCLSSQDDNFLDKELSKHDTVYINDD